MQIPQNELIIDYIKSLMCPHHNKPIKYINYTTNIIIGQRLICSDCAKNGIKDYYEVETAIHNMNQDKISVPIKNAGQQLSQSINSMKTKIDSLINPYIYFLKNIQDQQGITKFQEETQEYYLKYNHSKNSREEIIQQGKMIIFNSIKQLERFQIQMSSLLTHPEIQCQKFTEIYKQEYSQPILIETSFEDNEFYIFSSNVLEIFTTKVNGIELIQTINLPKIKINCMIKAQSKQLFFLGRQDGIVEIYEQLTNGKYISSHQIQAHSDDQQKKYYGVSCIITNQDNSEIITGGQDTLIKSWRYINYKWNLIQTLSQHSNVINSLSYNIDFNILGSASQDCSFSLYKSSSQNLFQNAFQITKETRINSICFVNSTNFFISVNQEKKIYLYQIINPLELRYKIQLLQTINLNEANTDITIDVQPRYYQQLNLLIFQSNKYTYILNSKDQKTFQIMSIQNQNSLKVNILRLFQFGQLSIQVQQNGSQYFLCLAKCQ